MKMPNGQGSVYKKGGHRRKPYCVVVTTGYTDDGKQIRKVLGYTKTPTEGHILLGDYIKHPFDIDLRKIKFCEVWEKVRNELKIYVESGDMSFSNLKGLTNAYENHLQPLHNEEIMNIKFMQMQDIITNAKKKNGQGNLGATAKGNMKTVCEKVFEYAIKKLEFPIKNIAQDLEIGKKESSEKHIPFTEQEIEILWQHQSNDLIKIILINIYNGARPNEIFTTTFDNIYLNENYIKTGSKTEAGKDRVIPIHPKVKPLYSYFYNKKTSYPFTTIFDKFNYSKFSREYEKLMNDLNIKHTPYDARHTFSTKMKRAKADEYILKRIMGHSIKDITESVYTHRTTDELYNEILKIS